MPTTIELPGLAEDVRTLPAKGARRDRRLQHLVDLYSSNAAADALQAEAAQSEAGPLATVLTAAAAVMGSARAKRVLTVNEAQDRLRDKIKSPRFIATIPRMIHELRQIASAQPETGACTVATALKLWSWTVAYFRTGDKARTAAASNAIDELADALCPLLAARCLVLEVTKNDGALSRDLCHVYSAHASALAGTACAELVFGYRQHLRWDEKGCSTCFAADQLDELEAFIPGIASGARTSIDVIEADGSHPAKEGPCVRFDGVETFVRLRNRLDGCLTGARIAKDRAAAVIAKSASAKTSKGRA